MKYLLIFLFSSLLFAESNSLKEVSEKVEKRKGYCSPLDKMTGKCRTGSKETDKKYLDKANKKVKEVSKKIKKKKGYCSPLDKIANNCGKKK